MDMWNWLMDCYVDRSLTLEDLEFVMRDEKAARNLWEEWSSDSCNFVEHVRGEVKSFIKYIKKKRNE
jgi:hypothetical protein